MDKNKPNLDLLRSMAIVLVILDHLLLAQNITRVGPWVSSWIGLVGVYFFFVHTCLVLMWSLDRKPHTLDFYIRRIFRIYPLAMAGVAITLLFHAPVDGTPRHFFAFWMTSQLGIISNFLLMQNLTDTGNVLGVLWSLPIEVDMYLLLPVLFFFVRKNFSVWPLLLLWGLGVGLALPHVAAQGNSMLTVIPCFVPGVMAYVVFARTRPLLPAWLFPLFLVLLCVGFLAHPDVSMSWPMCLALGLGMPFFRQIGFAPAIRLSHEIAKYSYGMYLSHSFGIVLGFYVLRGRGFWLELGVALGSTAIFSVAAYHLLERPMMRLGARLAARAEARYEQVEAADAVLRAG